DRQHVADLQAVAYPLVQGDNIELTNLADATRYIENQTIDVGDRLAGHEGGVDRTLLGGEQAISQAYFLSRALEQQRTHIPFFGDDLTRADVIGVDAKEFLGFRIRVGLALAEDTVNRLFFVE